jgi:hypothetical protein
MRAPWASADKQPEAETAPERRVTVILDERASQIADVLQDALPTPRLDLGSPSIQLTLKGGRHSTKEGRGRCLLPPETPPSVGQPPSSVWRWPEFSDSGYQEADCRPCQTARTSAAPAGSRALDSHVWRRTRVDGTVEGPGSD